MTQTPETFRTLDLDRRSAADVVVIIFAAVVAAILILTLIGAVVLKLVHPDMDLSTVSQVMTNTLGTIVGALVGFIGGKAVGKAEANGMKK
jgi:hypothetical protein